MSYKPRRQSKRWLDADCPKGVLAIYDHKNFADRYTVFYAAPLVTQGQTWIQYAAMSENPFHPQGVGIHGEMLAHQARAYRYAARHKACKWSSLPAAVKRCVVQNLVEELAA